MEIKINSRKKVTYFKRTTFSLHADFNNQDFVLNSDYSPKQLVAQAIIND